MNTEQYQQPEAYSVFEEMEQEKPLFYAGTGQRFLNHIIDTIIWYIFYLAIFFLLGFIQRLTGADILSAFMDEYGEVTGWVYVLFFGLWLVLYTFFEGALKGRTVGKMITGTRTVQEDGSDLTWKHAFLRSLCRFIPFDALSGLGGHPWHDTITKTMVIKTRNADV
jgi:uncharacterized RDD family membrane protein YckC